MLGFIFIFYAIFDHVSGGSTKVKYNTPYLSVNRHDSRGESVSRAWTWASF